MSAAMAAAAVADVVLAAQDVTVDFGGARALDRVSIEVRPGELVGLIGPNGAGKTTLFEVISGFTRPTSGRVSFDGHDITAYPPHRRSRAGIARSFQDAGLFGALRADATLQVALERRVVAASDTVGELLKLPSARRAERWSRARAGELLERFGLEVYRDLRVEELSTGMRRFLEIACVLAAEPRLLLLDEPTAGVARAEIDALTDLISSVHAEQGLSTLLVEHDVPMIMRLCDRVYVLEAGRLIAHGTPDEIRSNPRVVTAYLGVGFEDVTERGAEGA